VKSEDLEKLLRGVDLEDGKSKADKASYVEGGNSREVGIEIHSGKNRIVRRMFESLGYTVVKLDRVVFAGLTKKDLPRGMFRHLSEDEVSFLRMTKNV
jgi:23S rRNA pseudouridine2605 synthase